MAMMRGEVFQEEDATSVVIKSAVEIAGVMGVWWWCGGWRIAVEELRVGECFQLVTAPLRFERRLRLVVRLSQFGHTKIYG